MSSIKRITIAFTVAEVAAASSSSSSDRGWFCSHQIPWEECKKYLHSEREALKRFMLALDKANSPPPGSLKGQGIVMSGGPVHAMQALANLGILRNVLKSTLPVEFWHAYELSPPFCEQLAAYGAVCRELQVPGVYPEWQTTLPAILSSSFQQVLWIDTDITPLLPPETLFQTRAFQRYGALFWPDLWGAGCTRFGQSAWPDHVTLHLLDLEYNASDQHYLIEHEAGHLLIDKERHWKSLCLANYLGSRDFFQQVLHGYKDVFRLAWLKTGASNWFCPHRPGIAGAFGTDSKFYSGGLVHFWPPYDEFISPSDSDWPANRPWPLYLHQKKKPGMTWNDIVVFKRPFGECVKYEIGPLVVFEGENDLWDLTSTSSSLQFKLLTIERAWNKYYKQGLENLQADARLTEEDIPSARSPRGEKVTRQYMNELVACKCDYRENRWFILLSWLAEMGSWKTAASMGSQYMGCNWLQEDANTAICEIGYVALATVCAVAFMAEGFDQSAKHASSFLPRLLPNVEKCIPKSFWPLEIDDLQQFSANFSSLGLPGLQMENAKPLNMPWKRLKQFPRYLRRSIPLKDPACWAGQVNHKTDVEEHPQFVTWYCCDPNYNGQFWKTLCFDEVFTEARCCNMNETI